MRSRLAEGMTEAESRRSTGSRARKDDLKQMAYDEEIQ
jgi:hypothetical protein